jgi:hypothetical protein
MDVVHQLSLHRSLEGALKLANHHRASAVAERVALVLQQTDGEQCVCVYMYLCARNLV